MKKFKRIFNFKIIVLTLIFFLLIPCFSMLLPGLKGNSTVYASQISEDDAYKGIALFFILSFFYKYFEGDNKSVSAETEIEDIKSDELILLARLIHAEARGESYRGQVAVGAVVLNRVRSSAFPGTIKGVIYQEGQFTPVENGQFNLTPNPASFRAAKAALNGEDPSQSAVYFYNPDTARTLWWLSTRERTVKIGNHVFAK
jgi:N-acetylmuramoyl-L-alanine amidase